MKKILSLILVIALVAGIAVTGTMAYLTDRDNETNVFTVGDVDIELSEEYKDYSQLLPGVAVEKKPTIENVGSNDAWVWITYAVPTALADVVEVTPNAGWTLYADKEFTQDIEVDKQGTKINYTIFPVLYNDVLEAGDTTTAPAFDSVTLSASVDVKPDGSWFKVTSGTATPLNWNHNDDTNIYVNAYAIQKDMDNVATVQEAYANYVGQWGADLSGVYDPAPEKTTSAGFGAAVTAGGTIVLGEDVTLNQKIYENTDINLAGNTLNMGWSHEVYSDLSISGGDVLVQETYGHTDIRPDAGDVLNIEYTDVDFTVTKKNPTYGTSTDRLVSVLEFCAKEAGGKATIVFKNCVFNNASVLFEGMSGKTGEFTALFENCTFNCLTNSAPIEVENYVKGKITVKDCTFNIEATSSLASAVSVSPSSSTEVDVIFEGANKLDAKVATPTDSSVTGVDVVKVNGTPANIKIISSYDNCTVTGLDTVTVTGIATK